MKNIESAELINYIATYIMGWHVKFIEETIAYPDSFTLFTEGYHYWFDEEEKPVIKVCAWNPIENLNHSWMIVKRMEDLGYSWTIQGTALHSSVMRGHHICFKRGVYPPKDASMGIDGIGEAICISAKEAIERDKNVKN